MTVTATTAQPPFRVTNRLVLSIAVPMTLAFLTTPLLVLVGTAVVGQLGDAALLGGLAAGAIVFDIVFASFNFLRTGTTGLIAQALGRGDAREEQAIVWRALAVAGAVGILLALFAPLFAKAGAVFIHGAPAVSDALMLYVGIRLLSAPFALTNYTILGYALGRSEAGLGLAFQILVNGSNMALSILFGLVLGYGLAGVAWAAVVAECIGALTGLGVVLLRFRKLPPLGFAPLKDRAAMGAMFALNRDIMIRSFVLLAAFALFTRQGAQFGTVALAANAVLMNFFLVGGYFLDGFAAAAEQLAGRATGARDARAFFATMRLTASWGFALSGVLTLLFLGGGEWLIAQLTTAEDVRSFAGAYLPWAACTALSGVLAFQMDGIFMGTTWSRDLRNMMLLSFTFYAVALFTLGRLYGNTGLWLALHLFLIVRGLSLASRIPARVRAVFGT
jgi:putative MATE family efflux protein